MYRNHRVKNEKNQSPKLGSKRSIMYRKPYVLKHVALLVRFLFIASSSLLFCLVSINFTRERSQTFLPVRFWFIILMSLTLTAADLAGGSWQNSRTMDFCWLGWIIQVHHLEAVLEKKTAKAWIPPSSCGTNKLSTAGAHSRVSGKERKRDWESLCFFFHGDDERDYQWALFVRIPFPSSRNTYDRSCLDVATFPINIATSSVHFSSRCSVWIVEKDLQDLRAKLWCVFQWKELERAYISGFGFQLGKNSAIVI